MGAAPAPDKNGQADNLPVSQSLILRLNGLVLLANSGVRGKRLTDFMYVLGAVMEWTPTSRHGIKVPN